MRSLLWTGHPTTQFSEMSLKFGSGQITSGDNVYIDTTNIGHTESSPDTLCSVVYRNLTTEYIKPDWFRDRAVLAPTNAAVNTLNNDLLSQLPSQERCYRSVDTPLQNSIRLHNFQQNLSTSQHHPGFAPHELHLKVGCPVILLRSLNASTLCNGTRFIEAQIITGHGKNDTVFIPKIPLTPIDCPYTIFAMTINKAQCQSLKVVALDLRTLCFSHGQFYVGCSRVGHPDNLFIFAPEEKN
uniref:DNA helicase Pif1-like 2B domain-containing protein n=1 Tax=Octopus bimaculoides TaxID=37653 RepID=A0A0L8GNT0_OCTBM